MTYDLESLRQEYQLGKRPKYLFFWGHNEAKGPTTKACLSQWYPSQFQAEGERYQWAEQYMMAQKALLFEDREIFHKIMAAKHPGECKKLAGFGIRKRAPSWRREIIINFRKTSLWVNFCWPPASGCWWKPAPTTKFGESAWPPATPISRTLCVGGAKTCWASR